MSDWIDTVSGWVPDWVSAHWHELIAGARPFEAAGLVLTAIGTGVALYSTFKPSPPTNNKTTTDNGGLAINGNVSNCTISTGLTGEQVKAIMVEINRQDGAAAKEVAALSARLGVTDGAILNFFRILAEEKVPDDQLAAKLATIAERHNELLKQLGDLRSEDPEVLGLREKSSAAIGEGRYDDAESLLAEAEAADVAAAGRLREVSDQRFLNAATTRAERGLLARTRLRYVEAARHFAAAAELVPSGHDDQRLGYLNLEADTLYLQGDEFGDNAALRAAIARHQILLTLRPRERAPLQWATAQNNLGNALQTLGARESGTERLEAAVEAYRAALIERTRERAPLDWAMTQNNLGNALARLGERESGTERLQSAVEAYRAALIERTRERMPLQWAATQNNLGAVLRIIGARESGTERLQGAVEAYRAALEEYTRERVPLDWAMTQNNLGNALRTLGERESGTGSLQSAVEAYRAALTEYTRERVPLDWAMTQNNLGAVFRTIGERKSGTQHLEQAVKAYRAALEERTRERAPLDWAATQNNLGNALWTLGERESGTERLEGAVEAYRAALIERTRERVPLDWAMTQNNLGNALQALGTRENGTQNLEQAVEAFRAALQEYTRERVPLQWATTQNNLGGALWVLGKRTTDRNMLTEAETTISTAWSVYEEAGYEHYRAYFEERIKGVKADIAGLSAK